MASGEHEFDTPGLELLGSLHGEEKLRFREGQVLSDERGLNL